MEEYKRLGVPVVLQPNSELTIWRFPRTQARVVNGISANTGASDICPVKKDYPKAICIQDYVRDPTLQIRGRELIGIETLTAL
ncbi:hypothetical protein [Pseudoxanthomonas suwonensis]